MELPSCLHSIHKLEKNQSTSYFSGKGKVISKIRKQNYRAFTAVKFENLTS